jgi:hypothetical protein
VSGAQAGCRWGNAAGVLLQGFCDKGFWIRVMPWRVSDRLKGVGQGCGFAGGSCIEEGTGVSDTVYVRLETRWGVLVFDEPH